MIIDFNSIEEASVQSMNGGEGAVLARMHVGENARIILSRIPSGASIGRHVQMGSDDINYVMAGKGRAVYDGRDEILVPGICHICPSSHEHSIINDGEDELVLFTVVQKLADRN